MPKALFVTKDLRPVKLGIPIAEELKKLGWGIAVVAEGSSVAEWEKAGYPLLLKGPLDPVKEPFNFDPFGVIQKSEASVIITGLSSPIHAERKVGEAVLDPQFQRHWVALDDNWGAFTRVGSGPDLWLTIDGIGAQAIRDAHVGGEIVIMGDMAAAPPAIPEATHAAMKKIRERHECVFILASQKWPESDDIIDLAVRSFELTAGPYAVIPRFHPGAAPELKAAWTERVNAFELANPGAIHWIRDTESVKHNSDHLSALADATIAATGTGLRVAAHMRQFPICAWSERLSRMLLKESGLGHHPLVTAGAALELTEPRNLYQLMAEPAGSRIRANQELFLTPVPFNPKGAAEAIANLA